MLNYICRLLAKLVFCLKKEPRGHHSFVFSSSLKEAKRKPLIFFFKTGNHQGTTHFVAGPGGVGPTKRESHAHVAGPVRCHAPAPFCP